MKPVAKRPTKAELLATVNRKVPDVIVPNLRVLFVGINLGLYSAYTGYHFARPGNRFWPALYASGFTDRLLRPNENRELLRQGYGITNLVGRPTLAADELSKKELLAGARKFRSKVLKYRPRAVVILGVTAYRIAFESPSAGTGLQQERIGEARVWVLPNPSGLNAHFTPKTLATLFRRCRLQLTAPNG